MVKINGFDYQLSQRKNKKLKVFVNGKWVHFGDSRYENFKDKTHLLPVSYNHYDARRRHNYLRRAAGLGGVNDPNSANYHAMRILW
jgi:hypothetical protein